LAGVLIFYFIQAANAAAVAQRFPFFQGHFFEFFVFQKSF